VVDDGYLISEEKPLFDELVVLSGRRFGHLLLFQQIGTRLFWIQLDGIG